MPSIQTLGIVAGYTVAMNRRATQASDGTNGTTTLVINLSNGTNSYDAFATEDNPGSFPLAFAAGNAIVKAFAAIGASVTLGTAGQAPVTASPSGSTVYTRAVPLTPGTPLPAGRGAFVKSSGGATVLLKLANGGSIPVSDPGGGFGFTFNNLAVVDADISNAPGASVQILY